MTTRPKPLRRKGRKADYGKATPEQVAKALHRYRPGRSVTRGNVAEDPTPNS